MLRRPVVDDHDFHCDRNVTDDGEPVEIRVTGVLVDLSDEARRRFYRHLRRWDDAKPGFADEEGADLSGFPERSWALPIAFIGRYDRDEDEFVGNTFFDHPQDRLDGENEGVELTLGEGRKPFTRDL